MLIFIRESNAEILGAVFCFLQVPFLVEVVGLTQCISLCDLLIAEPLQSDITGTKEQLFTEIFVRLGEFLYERRHLLAHLLYTSTFFFLFVFCLFFFVLFLFCFAKTETKMKTETTATAL